MCGAPWAMIGLMFILLIKNQWGSALIVSGWVVLAWSRDSCLGQTEVPSFVFLILILDGRPSASQDFILLFHPRDGKVLVRSFTRCDKIENVLWEWEVGRINKS